MSLAWIVFLVMVAVAGGLLVIGASVGLMAMVFLFVRGMLVNADTGDEDKTKRDASG